MRHYYLHNKTQSNFINMNKYQIAVRSTLAGVAVASCGGSKTVYPEAPMDTTVVEVRSGVEFPDPYRPLENDTAEATTAWVKAENAVT